MHVSAMTIHPQVQRLLAVEQPEQRTEAWYEARRHLLTASNVAAALGIKPYASYQGDPRADLIKKAVLGTKVSGPFLEHGVLYEPEAIAQLERHTGETVREVGLFRHPEHAWLGGSPDGLTESGCTVEVKCPQSRPIVPGQVPHHYWPQVQVCMEICDLEACWFAEYKPQCLTWPRDPELNVVKVARDRQWFAANLEAMHSCWKQIEQGKQDPEAFMAKLGTRRRAPCQPRARKAQPQPPPCPILDSLYG